VKVHHKVAGERVEEIRSYPADSLRVMQNQQAVMKRRWINYPALQCAQYKILANMICEYIVNACKELRHNSHSKQ
jgi:hypothetical protein